MAIYDVNGNQIPTGGGGAAKDTRSVLHQGWHTSQIEGNSKTAFIEAFNQGFTIVEADVDVTSDGIYVMSHDSVAGVTYAAWYAANTDRITFDQFLDIVKKTNINVYLDGKSGVAGSAGKTEVYNRVSQHGLLNNFSFFGTLETMYTIDATVRCLGSPGTLTKTWIDNARDGIPINTNYVNLTAEVAAYAIEKGHELEVYTLSTEGNFLACYNNFPQVTRWTTDNLSVDAVLAENL